MGRFLVGLAVACVATAAYANGRPPVTNGIFFKPNDPHSLYVRTTFGLLISHDDGCTMSWVCEDNIGYGGSFDPKYAIATDGTIFATTYSGLRISRDGGCSFTTNASLPANTWIDALDIGPTGEVWVGTATSGAPNDVYSSVDGGTTFASRGMTSPSIWWKSVKVAKSNAMRVYLSGYQVAGMNADGGTMPPTAHLLHSDDDGATWTESPLAGVTYGSTPIVLVAAVDLANADVAYVISVGANPPSGDKLYRTSDAGMTLTPVLSTTDAIRDVVVIDATHVAVATQLGGSYVSTTSGTSFSAMPTPPQLDCLGQSPGGSLIGCGANWDPDHMAVAKSVDTGQSWAKVWRFVELAGPLSCPAGTSEHDVCGEQQWPTIQSQFATTGPTCGANIVDGTVDAPSPPKKKKGCCDVGGGGATGSLACAAAVALVLRRRRRVA